MRVIHTTHEDAESYLASPECHAHDDASAAEAVVWWSDSKAQLLAEEVAAFGDVEEFPPESFDAAGEPEDSYEQPEPVHLADPVSPVLFAHLAHRVIADASSSGLVDGLTAWQRFEGFATAHMWREIAELHARVTGPAKGRLDQCLLVGDEDAALDSADEIDLAERSLGAEVAAALGWSHGRASGQVEIALILTSDLTRTLDAVAAGRIDVRRAEAIARALAREESDLRRLVEAEILPGASDCNPPELRNRIKKALLRAAPELAERRAEAARKQRGVSFKSQPDDMVLMEAFLPVEDGILVQAALESAALDQRAMPGEGRSLHQVRADLVSVAISGLVASPADPVADEETTRPPATDQSADDEAASGQSAVGETPDQAAPGQAADGGTGEDSIGSCTCRHRVRAGRTGDPIKRALRREVVVTVPFATLTGAADEPGEISRYGPVSAHIARVMAWQVAVDGYWRCAITDDVHGTLLGLGRSTFTPAYRPPEYLQRFANLRHRTCDFPGCQIAAAACDFDHTIAYPQGSTCECGGAKRCRGHHRLKHETGWSVRKSDDPLHPPGTHVWSSPLGREYLRRPAVIGVPQVGVTHVGVTRSGRRASEKPGPPDPPRHPDAPKHPDPPKAPPF